MRSLKICIEFYYWIDKGEYTSSKSVQEDMDATIAKRIIPKIKRWIEISRMPNIPDLVSRLIIKLYREKEGQSSLSLLKIVLSSMELRRGGELILEDDLNDPLIQKIFYEEAYPLIRLS